MNKDMWSAVERRREKLLPANKAYTETLARYGWLMGEPSGEIDPLAVGVALFSADIRLSQDRRLDFFNGIDIGLLAMIGSVNEAESLLSEKKVLIEWRQRVLNLIESSLVREEVFDKEVGKLELPVSEYWRQAGLSHELQQRLEGIPHQAILIGSAALKTEANSVQVKDLDLIVAVDGGEEKLLEAYEQLEKFEEWRGIPISHIVLRPKDLDVYHAMSPHASFEPHNSVVVSNTTKDKIGFYPRKLAWKAKIGRLRVQLDLVRTLQGERDVYSSDQMKRRLKKRAVFSAMMLGKQVDGYSVPDDAPMEEIQQATAEFLVNLLD